MKTQSSECPNSIRNYEKNDWNIRCLIDESFIPSTQRANVLYYRLSDFRFCLLAPESYDLLQTEKEMIAC